MHAGLVMIGARPDGTKELVALEDGYRESTDSWAEGLRDLQRRGLRRWSPSASWGSGRSSGTCGRTRRSNATGQSSVSVHAETTGTRDRCERFSTT